MYLINIFRLDISLSFESGFDAEFALFSKMGVLEIGEDMDCSSIYRQNIRELLRFTFHACFMEFRTV